jgi:hypothetical protein
MEKATEFFKKNWIWIVVAIIVFIIIRSIVAAKLTQPENASRSVRGWRLYNLINHGQYAFKRTTPIVNIKTI